MTHTYTQNSKNSVEFTVFHSLCVYMNFPHFFFYNGASLPFEVKELNYMQRRKRASERELEEEQQAFAPL